METPCSRGLPCAGNACCHRGVSQAQDEWSSVSLGGERLETSRHPTQVSVKRRNGVCTHPCRVVASHCYPSSHIHNRKGRVVKFSVSSSNDGNTEGGGVGTRGDVHL